MKLRYHQMKIRDLFEPKSYDTIRGWCFSVRKLPGNKANWVHINNLFFLLFYISHFSSDPSYQLCIFIMFSWPYIRSNSVINTKTGKILTVLVLMPSGRQWKLNCSNNYLMIWFIIKQMFLKYLVEGFMYQNGQGRKYSIKKS